MSAPEPRDHIPHKRARQRIGPVKIHAMALIMVLWAVTPGLACLLPGQGMTAAEQECCPKMAAQCGSAMMPSSHTCCQHPDERETSVSPVAKYSAPRHFTMAVLPQAVIVPICSASISGHSLELRAPQPEASPGCSSTLRICDQCLAYQTHN